MKVAEQNPSLQSIHKQCSVEHGTYGAGWIFVSIEISFVNCYSKWYLKVHIIIELFILLIVNGKNMMMPGEHGAARLTTLEPMVVSSGQRFSIREGKTTVLTGIVTKEHPIISIPKKRLSLIEFKE